jgi:hypothetical protein
LIGLKPVEEGNADGGRTMEEYDYKCTENLGYDI